MKVLIISANFLPASPSGPAYIAGAALEAGHDVEVFEALFAKDLIGELKAHLDKFTPDVVAISIRLVHGFILDENAQYGTRHLDLRINVKEIVECIKQNLDAHIVLGGPGFNYYGPDWLEYLELDYGIRGEADNTFPLYLKTLEAGGDLHIVPGSVYRSNGRIEKSSRALVDDVDTTAMPAYQLFDLENYYQKGISPAITTKRGCAFNCTYCPYASLEGKRYRLKSPQRVVDEIEHIYSIKAPKMVSFCDNNFNVPNRHALAICQEIIDRKLDIAWGTGTVKPLKLTQETLQIFKDSGCGYLSLSVESASETMLEENAARLYSGSYQRVPDEFEPYGYSFQRVVVVRRAWGDPRNHSRNVGSDRCFRYSQRRLGDHRDLPVDISPASSTGRPSRWSA